MLIPITVSISVYDKYDKLCDKCAYLEETIDNNSGVKCRLFGADLNFNESTMYEHHLIRCAACLERTRP